MLDGAFVRISKVVINLLILFELGKYTTWHKKQLHSPLYLLFSTRNILLIKFNHTGLAWREAARHLTVTAAFHLLKRFCVLGQGDSPLIWMIPAQ